MTATTNPMPIYPKNSFGYWWQRTGAAIGVIALIYTAFSAFSAEPCIPARELLGLAVICGVWPPLWWWCEFFFVFSETLLAREIRNLETWRAGIASHMGSNCSSARNLCDK